MRVCLLLTHSQKNFALSVSLCISAQPLANEPEGYRRTVGRRYVAKHRRRSDETLLEAFFAAYISATSKTRLTKCGSAYGEWDGNAKDEPKARCAAVRARKR